MITYTKVFKKFRTLKREKKTVLNNFDLTVDNGEIFGLLGPNGAGKSTAIKLLLDFIRPDSGTIQINNIPATSARARNNLGYLPENPYFYSHLTAWETLRFCGRTSGLEKTTIEHEGTRLLERLRLTHAAKQPIRTYSKGMTQRLGLAVALLHNPELLIFDEPMSGLDPVGRRLVADLINDLKNQGKTVFMCSHILSDIETMCNRIGVIHQSSLRYCGSIDTLLADHKDLETAFLSIIGETREDA